MSRAAGILMPITSLPGKYGIGCFATEADAFLALWPHELE